MTICCHWGCYLKSIDGGRKEGFCVCSERKMTIHKEMMPRSAIANNYYFGTLPQCLVKLTEVELAMLTLVKTYGYCFSFTGGCNNWWNRHFCITRLPWKALRGLWHISMCWICTTIVWWSLMARWLAYTYTTKHTHTYVCKCKLVNTYTPACTRWHTLAHKLHKFITNAHWHEHEHYWHAHTSTCTYYTCTQLHIHTYIHTYIQAHAHAHTHAYARTHIHASPHQTRWHTCTRIYN